MAEALDVTEQHFDRSLRPLAAKDGIKKVGGRLYFHSRRLIDAWLAAQNQKSPQPTEAELLFPPDAEGESLDVYRKVKTAQEQIKLDLMRGDAIPRAELEPAMSAFFGVVRRAGEALQRQYGDDAAAILNDAVDETAAGWERLLNPPSDPSANAKSETAVLSAATGPGPGSAAANDAAVR